MWHRRDETIFAPKLTLYPNALLGRFFVEMNLRLETISSSINGSSNNNIECNAPPTIDMRKIIHLSPVG